MKSSTMVGIIIGALVVLVGGWYLWSSNGTMANNMPIPMNPDTTNVNQTATQPVSPTPTTPTPTPTSTTTTSAAMTAQVSYDGHTFSPATITVAKGGKVTFTDTASAQMWVASDPHPTHTNYDGTTRAQHCASGATPSFDQCSPGATYSFTFGKAGSWSYHNHFNPAAMGTVVVQ